MVALLKISKVGGVPSKFRKAWRQEAKPVWKRTAELWHRRYREKHFTAAGAREYKYARRAGENLNRGSKVYRRSYTGRKEALFGHTLPNVYTGLMRRLSRRLDVRASQRGARVNLHVKARVYPKTKSRVNQLRELSAVSQREAAALTKDHDRRLNGRLATFRERSDVRLRG